MRRIVLLILAIAIFAGMNVWGQTNLVASIAQFPDLSETAEKGTFIDMVKAIDRVYREGNIQIGVYPFARSIENVLRGDADFHIPMFRNPEIDESSLFFINVPEPTGQVTLVIYSHKNKPITRDVIAKAMAAGGTFPYVIEVGMDFMFPFKTAGTNDIEQSLRKVQAGRIDAFIWPPEGDLIVKALKLGNLRRDVYGVFDDTIMVPKTPRGEEVAKLLDAALKELKKQGQLKQYHDRVHLKYEPWQPYEMGW